MQINEDTIVVDGFGERGLCFGDSGAPIFSKNDREQTVLLAIASHGDTSCLGRDHLVRLTTNNNWLNEQVDHQSQSDEVLCQEQLYPPPQCDGDVRIGCMDNGLDSTDCRATNRICLETPGGAHCVLPTDINASPEDTGRDAASALGYDGGIKAIGMEQSASEGCQTVNPPNLGLWFFVFLFVPAARSKRSQRLRGFTKNIMRGKKLPLLESPIVANVQIMKKNERNRS